MNIDPKKALIEANKLLLLHDKNLSFNHLIEPNLEIFSKFRLMYSSNNTISNFGYRSLDKIEEQCSSLKKFFYGKGLLFFSKEIWKLHQKQQTVYISLDYSLSFDSNVAEKFRVHENGGKVEPKDKFENLLKFIKEYQFNFDYGFFCLENLESIKLNNERLFNTLRAIIRCNPLNSSYLDREEAGKLAIQKMYNPFNDEINRYFWRRRKLIYAVILKAILINWDKRKDVNYKLKEIITFSLEKLGKFAKKELYLAWKLFKYGNTLRFFDPVKQPSKKILSKTKGMSWDFLSIEYQSSLGYNLSRNGTFFVPFFATFDNRFVEFREACPIKCMLIDDYSQVAHIYFEDELEFNQDISNAIESNDNLCHKLSDQGKILSRTSWQLDSKNLDRLISMLEEKINQITV